MIELTDLFDKLPLIQYATTESSFYTKFLAKNLYSFGLGVACGFLNNYVVKPKNWTPVGSVGAGAFMTYFNNGNCADFIADTSLIIAGEYLTFKALEKFKQRKAAK